MKIGIYIGVIQAATNGGGATFQQSLLNELIKTETEHEFYIFYNADTDLFHNKSKIKFINLEVEIRKNTDSHKKLSKWDKLFSKKNKAKVKEKNVLNEQVLRNNIELVWFLIPYYSFVEAPFVLTVWDLQHRLQPYFPEVSLSGWIFDQRESFYSNAIPKASYVVIGNKEGARQVEQFYNYPQERIKTIPLCTPQFVFEEKPDDNILSKYNLDKNKYLFYPAQFWPHKNHIRILKALSILKKQDINLEIVFSGSDKGNLNYIQEKVKDFNLTENVKFVGFITTSEMISLYKNAFAMTFLSMFGPDNLPPLEAMALNCPVIAANVKGMIEQLGDSALFFDPLNENDLAEKIKLLFEDDNLKASLINNGYNLANSLTTDKYIKSILQLFEEFVPIRECWSNTQKYIHL